MPENIPKNTLVNNDIRPVFFSIFAVIFWEPENHVLKEPGKHACHKVFSLAEELVKEIAYAGCRYKHPREGMITYEMTERGKGERRGEEKKEE